MSREAWSPRLHRGPWDMSSMYPTEMLSSFNNDFNQKFCWVLVVIELCKRDPCRIVRCRVYVGSITFKFFLVNDTPSIYPVYSFIQANNLKPIP